MSGWLAVSVDAKSLAFAHARSSGSAASVHAYGSRQFADEADAERAARELRARKHKCTTLLSPGQYQLMMLEAPDVPAAELKSAMRWRVKDMIDYPLDRATFDMITVPREGSGRQFIYAVAASNEVIGDTMRRFHAAKIPLSVIDIPELAQRNVAARCERDGRGVALVHFGPEQGLVTVCFRGELYLARRIEVSAAQLAASSPTRGDAFERVTLELQRTLDHFERQFGHIPVGRLVVAPLAGEDGIVSHLTANLSITVESLDLSTVLAFDQAADAETQWRLFHHFGAALRNGRLQ